MSFSVLNSFAARRFVLALLVLMSVIKTANSQQVNGIQTINAFVDSLSKKLPPEKIYLQTDRNYYNPGDTVWFKGYLFDAKYLTASIKSGVVYLDVINDNNKIVNRLVLQCIDGLFRGSIPLNKDEVGPGTYTLRGYTNWMRNWGSDLVFVKQVFIINNSPAPKPIEVTSATVSKKATESDSSLPGNTDIDLQFMPEGGKLINGLKSKIGFKAIATDGTGIGVLGKVYNSEHQEVTTFKSLNAGMGYFELTPVAGQQYFADVILNGGEVKKYVLPKAQSLGVVLKVTNDFESEVLKIKLQASPEVSRAAAYHLVIQARGVVCYGAVMRFNDGAVNLEVAKSKFPTGIARITLFDGNLRPVIERLTFIDRNDRLTISLQTEKQSYLTRDSVSLKLKVTNYNGEPVQGSFSLAVTDDGLITADTATNIATRLLLTADLKGTVDSPTYYFMAKPDNWAALDCLLLTQGWVGYSWSNHFEVPAINYPAEPEFAITGKITNLLNKGVPKTQVKLFSRHPFFTMDTVTNANGYFSFKNLPAIDTANFLLQAVKRNGKSMNIGFEMQDTEPLPVAPNLKHPMRRFYADSVLQTVINNNIEAKQKTEAALFGKHVLKEVVIKGQKVIKGSHNLNGPGNADEVIDEKELLKANKTPLMELLIRRISGFHEGMFPARIAPDSKMSYMIKMHRVKLIFDGINVEDYFQPDTERKYDRLFYLKGVIEQFTAEDIKGMEVMYSGKYNNAYNATISSHENVSPVNDLDYAYIEITTRSGKGPLINSKDGFYGYRPLMPTWSKQFYAPKYQTRETPLKTDFRSTLHWQPDIITDTAGQATIKFFTSDRTGTFTIITQGSNMKGEVGFGKGKFKVK